MQKEEPEDGLMQHPLVASKELQESINLSQALPSEENLSETDRCLMHFYGMTEAQVRAEVRKLIEQQAQATAEKLVQENEEKFRVVLDLMEELEGVKKVEEVKAPSIEEDKEEFKVGEQRPKQDSFVVVPQTEWLQFC